MNFLQLCVTITRSDNGAFDSVEGVLSAGTDAKPFQTATANN